MVDPATGRPGQAVITDVSETSVRLTNQFNRRFSFPRQSFRQVWRFVQSAPEQVCAYDGCQDVGYLQVNQLGRWVWVCRAHCPIHIRPLLPTEDPQTPQGGDEGCPLCGALKECEGASVQTVGIHQIHGCGVCNSRWIRMVGNEEGVNLATWALEVIPDTATLFEERGLRVQAFVGEDIQQAILETYGTAYTSNASGVPIRAHRGGPLEILVTGDRPATNVPSNGVRRLGGQPDRVTTGTTIPNVGSEWIHKITGKVLRVEGIRYATQIHQAGRRIRVDGIDGDGEPVEIWLEDFGKEYAVYTPDIESLPSVGEEWEDSAGIWVKIAGVEEDQIVVELSTGNRAIVPAQVFMSRYKKAPIRRTALERLLEDD